eukprot:Gb_38848 [translate_table: standard]
MLQILEDNHIFAKRSKCEFGKGELEYLGHIISGEGVKLDTKKIQSSLIGQYLRALQVSEDSWD